MAGQYSPGQLDAMARQAGFQNYAQWQAWNNRTRNVVLQQGNAAPAQPAQQNNWLQNLMESIPGHPAMLMRYVDKRLGQAFGSKK